MTVAVEHHTIVGGDGTQRDELVAHVGWGGSAEVVVAAVERTRLVDRVLRRTSCVDDRDRVGTLVGTKILTVEERVGHTDRLERERVQLQRRRPARDLQLDVVDTSVGDRGQTDEDVRGRSAGSTQHDSPAAVDPRASRRAGLTDTNRDVAGRHAGRRGVVHADDLSPGAVRVKLTPVHRHRADHRTSRRGRRRRRTSDIHRHGDRAGRGPRHLRVVHVGDELVGTSRRNREARGEPVIGTRDGAAADLPPLHGEGRPLGVVRRERHAGVAGRTPGRVPLELTG